MLVLTPAYCIVKDQSTRAVVHRIQLHLQDEAAYLFKGRVRIVK